MFIIWLEKYVQAWDIGYGKVMTKVEAKDNVEEIT